MSRGASHELLYRQTLICLSLRGEKRESTKGKRGFSESRVPSLRENGGVRGVNCNSLYCILTSYIYNTWVLPGKNAERAQVCNGELV